jgi:hypothetical protein
VDGPLTANVLSPTRDIADQQTQLLLLAKDKLNGSTSPTSPARYPTPETASASRQAARIHFAGISYLTHRPDFAGILT